MASVDKLSINSTITLNNQSSIPVYGFGMSHNEGGVKKDALKQALNLGIRLYDTAKRYETEGILGECLNECKHVRRSNLFLTSKLWTTEQECFSIHTSCQETCQRMNIDYLDLYLVHWPGKLNSATVHIDKRQAKLNRQDIWRSMELLVDKELTQSIGISNFLPHHISDVLETCSIIPQINQIEFNPWQHPKELIQYCRNYDIQVEGYCPLSKGNKLSDSRLNQICRKYGKSPAQILLRWSLEHNVIVIPKTNSIKHLEENLDCMNFTLEKKDWEEMNSWHENLRVTWDPTHVL